MKNGQEKWRAWAAAAGMSVLAGGGAWGVELPWVWEGEMAFGRDRTEWVVDLEGAPKRVEVRLEGGGGAFAVDEASWDGEWNGTPMGWWKSGTGGWAETRLLPDAVTRHLRFRAEGGEWVLKGVRVAGNDGVTQVVFDREDGFAVEEGAEEVAIHAQVLNGGGGWFGEDAWECDEGAGRGDGAVFRVDTGVVGWHWARVRAGCDGSDEEVEGLIRWWVGNEGDATGGPPTPPALKSMAIDEPVTQPISFARVLGPRATIGEYYAACYGPDGQLLSGKELKAALCRIVNEGTTTNAYGSNLNSILKTTDACPSNPDLVQCIYLQRGISGFNKEHLWPQSHGIDGRYPAYSDLHHLRASESSMNSTRGNLDFDNCRDEPDAKEKNGCWYTKRAWEPPDSAKGDVARAVLYMAVRYETGANPNGDLELVEATGTGPGTNVLGRLSTLLDWNELDPVDEFEIQRNELIYSRYQGNRNPFVDHPEWVRRVFAPGSWSGKEGARAVLTGLEARQRYPWNGLVDIDYEIAIQGGRGDEEVWVDVFGRDLATGEKVSMRALSGAGVSGPVKAGRYRMTWDLGTDAPTLVSDGFAVQMFTGGSPAPYLVVDMAGGANAEHWNVETWESEPFGGWSEEYKTTKLVLRQIGPGKFAMGSRKEERGRQEDEELHEVNLSRSCWMGIFEVTQKQWELATGSKPSVHKGDTRPVEGVSFEAIRETSIGQTARNGHADGGDSFIGVLRAKTGMDFDLPTEAQWEYVCRAGTRTALNSGKDLSGLEECENVAELGRYAGDRSDGKGEYGEHTVVGSYQPNAWGFYDMHGNVAEWCRDWYGAYDIGTASNPPGAAFGTMRIRRGGDWEHAAKDVRSASRGRALPATADASTGFRLSCEMRGSRSQRLSFGKIGVHAVDERVPMRAIATGGGDVTFTVVSGPGVVVGDLLSFTGTGRVVVCATQSGNEDWWPVHAEQAVEVTRVIQQIAFEPIGAQTVTNNVVLSAKATGDGEVTYSVVSGPGRIEGNVLSFTGVGEVVVEATQEGDDFWAPVSERQLVRVWDVGLLFSVGVDAEITHGCITPSVLAATEGEVVTVDIEPEEGWKLSTLTVNGVAIKGASFVMPAADVVVSAVFVERVKSTYALVETVDEFEPGGEYVLVAQTPGLFCSALRNGIKASRIGVTEVETTNEDTVITDSDSIVWKIAPGAQEGTWTIYNEEIDAFAASPSIAENHSQLLSDGTNLLSQWTMEWDNLPQVVFRSVRYPDRWLSRNLELGNEYFAAYRSYGRLPCLYKKGGDVFKVYLDKANGFTAWKGKSTNIVARAKYGTPPYSYVWAGDCAGDNPALEIPDTLDTGEYAVTLTVRDSEGREISKTISFVVRIPEMQGLTIDGPATVGAGETAAYTCEARYSDGTRLPVSPDWTLVDGDKYASIDSDGVVSAHEVRVKKTVTLQAQFEDVFGSKTIEILPKETDQDVTVATWPLYYSGAGGTDFPMALSVGDFLASTNLSSSYSYSYFTSSGWPSEEANDDFYCEFSVTPTGMWPLKVGEIIFNFRSQTTGPSHVELRYALDNEWISVASTDLGNESGTVTRSWELEALDITVSPGQTLRFRLYAWGASRTSGTLRVNQPLTLYGQLVGMPTNHFAIALSPNKNFEVVQGQSASIVATAVDPFGDVTYQWSSGGAPGVAQANVFTIDSSEVGGPYTVTCNANDGAFDATSRSVSFTIVAPLEYYPVAVDSEIEGGTIVPSHAEAAEGTMVSIAVLPDIGMQLKEITINGTPSGTTFQMPATSVVIGARFSELAGSTFTRIGTADEFEEGADYLIVSSREGAFTSAMAGRQVSGYLGVEELGLEAGSDIATCSDSLIWTIRKNGETGRYTLFNQMAGSYAAFDGTNTYLVADGNAPQAQWTMDFSLLPTVRIASAVNSNRYLQRNGSTSTHYFAAYTGTNALPCLFKKRDERFSIALEPTTDFRIIQGESAAIVAIAYDSDGPVEWRWETDGVPGYSNENVFHIDTFALGGPYTVVCSANDGTSDCVAPQQVTFSVVAPDVDVPAYIEGGIGVTPGFRVDARAGNGATLEAKKKEWAVWDAAWAERTARVEATLERPGGAVETLGGGDGGSARGSAEWAPGEDEWGTFRLRLASWDADGEPLGEWLALRVRPMPVERAYAEWVAARGGTMESLPMEEDADGDGANNWEEYVADTDPLDEGEVFESQVVVGEDGVVRVVPSVVSTGRVYGVRMAGDLQEGDLREAGEWVDLGPGREGIGAELDGGKGGVGFGVVGVSVP